jgi:hypothetical protein
MCHCAALTIWTRSDTAMHCWLVAKIISQKETSELSTSPFSNSWKKRWEKLNKNFNFRYLALNYLSEALVYADKLTEAIENLNMNIDIQVDSDISFDFNQDFDEGKQSKSKQRKKNLKNKLSIWLNGIP